MRRRPSRKGDRLIEIAGMELSYFFAFYLLDHLSVTFNFYSAVTSSTKQNSMSKDREQVKSYFLLLRYGRFDHHVWFNWQPPIIRIAGVYQATILTTAVFSV